MSRVTNCILHMGCLTEDERKSLLARANQFLNEQDETGFTSLNDEDLIPWYGGSAFFTCDLAIGAFRNFDLPALLDHLRTIRWPDPGVVQLVVMEPDDFRFRIVDLFPELPAQAAD